MVLVVALVLVAGCELTADLAVDVDRDGAGTVGLALMLDDELAARAAEADLDVFAPIVDAAADDDAWLVEVDGDALTLTASFADPGELAALTGALARDLAAPELTPLGPVTVELADDRLTVAGAAGLELTEAVTDLGFDEQQAQEQLAEAVDYQVTVTVPGEVLEVAPDGAVDERSVTWSVPSGQEIDFRVVARRPPAVAWWVWAVVGAAIVAIGAGAVVLLRRRRAAP